MRRFRMMQTISHIDEIMAILKRELGGRQPPLVSRDKWEEIPKTPFTVLVSCILSLRTKDQVTDEASIRLLKTYNTPKQLLSLSEEELQQIIYPVGFYRVKARTIQSISKTLLEKYDGKVPDSFKELLKLKGVGRKTANIVMVYGHHNSDYLPIDTHCHRIPNRLGWIKTKTPEETEQALKKILPKRYWMEFNHLFVTFGQTICLPVSPLCSQCPINHYCKKVGVSVSR
jgi:endonuclease-3